MQNEDDIYYDEFDREIYRAMLELGWILPRTIEEVEIAERFLPDIELPEHLKAPPIEKLRERIKEWKK